MKPAAPDLPPVTADHLRRAYTLLALRGTTLEAALADPLRGAVLRSCAASLRTRDYMAQHARSTVPVKRMRLGADGHPLWCTQWAAGQVDHQQATLV